MRKIYERSRELLRLPIPDSFLGRKTQEPFSKEGDENSNFLAARHRNRVPSWAGQKLELDRTF